jgi:hypothetical protein
MDLRDATRNVEAWIRRNRDALIVTVFGAILGVVLAIVISGGGEQKRSDVSNVNTSTRPPSVVAPPTQPADADGDGVPDATDKCPQQAAATAGGCPTPPPRADRIVYLATLFEDNKTGGGTNVSFGNGATGSAYLGTTEYPHSILYSIYAGDRAENGVLTVPLEGRYDRLDGVFGIARGRNDRCPTARAVLEIEDDTGATIWPSGRVDGKATAAHPVRFHVGVSGVGGLKFAPTPGIQEGECLNNEIVIAFGNGRLTGHE